MCENETLRFLSFWCISENGGAKQEDRNKEQNEIIGVEGQLRSTTTFDVTYQSSMF